MNLPAIPGFGWASSAQDKVILHGEVCIVSTGEFPSSRPAELVNLVSENKVEVNEFTRQIEGTLKAYFSKEDYLLEELNEFYATGKSNDRVMKWHLMKIAPNTSFKLHAHQNIELIYVIKGTMHEVRNIGFPPKRIFPVSEKEGPNLSDESLALQFSHRRVPQGSFLVNEKGSIHLSYTLEDGAELLTLWSGSHGNIPADQYPVNSAELLALPVFVVPY
jgi:hypothetical protein